MHHIDPNHTAGVRLFEAMAGLPVGTVDKAAAFNAAVEADDEAGLKQTLCAIAADVLENSGRGQTKVSALCRHLSEQSDWNPKFDVIPLAVADALGRDIILQADEAEEKSSGVVRALPGLTGNVMRNLVGAGAATGAVLGSAAFLVGREASQDSARNEALRARTEFYRRLNASLEHELERKGVLSDDDVKRIAVEHQKDFLIAEAQREGKTDDKADKLVELL